jgi:hypothetical protein
MGFVHVAHADALVLVTFDDPPDDVLGHLKASHVSSRVGGGELVNHGAEELVVLFDLRVIRDQFRHACSNTVDLSGSA